MSKPLAERMRPQRLSDYIRQTHLIGKNAALLKVLQSKALPSMIFWGPPGIGKTSLAVLISKETDRPFHQLSAINSGVKEVREIIDLARKDSGLFQHKQPLLFIDEIHRFSKSQQDSLLGAVEKGWITLIGATTENPSFEVIPALLSRCQIYTLNEFTKNELLQLVQKAISEDQWLQQKKIELKETDALIQLSGGDARKLLNNLELVVQSQKNETIQITNQMVEAVVQKKSARYDKTGEQHYDIISAFIKSIRGSDPNAGVYWLARMIEGGEDVKFIARRLIILASEDIGLANPTALVMANNTFQAVTTVGFPEARIILSQCVIYLATSPKSNSAYLAINAAQKLVKQTGDLPVPLALRNAPTQLMKDLNYGKAYHYAHDFPNHFIEMEFLPEEIKGSKLFTPSNNTKEKEIAKRIQHNWKGKY